MAPPQKSSTKPGSSTLSFSFLAVSVVVVAVLAAVLSPFPAATPYETTAMSILLADGRSLVYQVSGSATGDATLLYIHRALGSRLESSVLNSTVLEELKIRVVSFDRPGYGQSSPQTNRSLASFADDVSQLAVSLKLEKLIVVAGASAAPYALALSALLPDRVQGTLLISPIISKSGLSAEEKKTLAAADSGYPSKLLQTLLAGPGAGLLVKAAQLPAASWLLYKTLLSATALAPSTAFDGDDETCLSEHPEVTAGVSEGLLQQSAGSFLTDLSVLLAPLPFNLTSPGPVHIIGAIHDPVAPAVFSQAISERLPGSTLELLEENAPGHLAWWLCAEPLQRMTLSSLIAATCTDTQAGCAGWKASGECGKNQVFMNDRCKKSCGVCGMTDASLATLVVEPCVNSDERCAGWQGTGECDLNPTFMNATCKLACKKC